MEIEFVDTHTHLYDEAFAGEYDEAVQRAVEQGVGQMIFPDLDAQSREAMFDLAWKYPQNCFPCLGLHPTSVGADWEEEFGKLTEYRDRRIFAIGETGMDCYWSKDFVREQELSFERHVELAHELGLPLIIHSREATGLIINVLRRYKHLAQRGVFHAFSGSIETFRELQSLGDWYVGIGGVSTYKNASIALTLKDIPLERIVLETDSPYLTPVPYRGKRNESANIPIIAAKVAQIKDLSVEEVATVTTDNARALFKL